MNGAEFNSLRRCVILNELLKDLSASLRVGLIPLSTCKPKTLYFGIRYDDLQGVREKDFICYPVILDTISLIDGVFDADDIYVVLHIYDHGGHALGVLISNSETDDDLMFLVNEDGYRFLER